MHSSPRIPTWLGRLAVAGLLGARALSGQTGDETELAFQRLEQAMAATDYRAEQVRRVRGHFAGFGRGGEWVGALETALHRSAQGDAREGEFALELNGFEGVSMSPGELAQRQLLYRSRAAYLFRYQSFRVL